MALSPWRNAILSPAIAIFIKRRYQIPPGEIVLLSGTVLEIGPGPRGQPGEPDRVLPHCRRPQPLDHAHESQDERRRQHHAPDQGHASRQQEAEAGEAPAEAGTGESAASDDDGTVVDADFEEVDDERKDKSA